MSAIIVHHCYDSLNSGQLDSTLGLFDTKFERLKPPSESVFTKSLDFWAASSTDSRPFPLDSHPLEIIPHVEVRV